MASDVPIEEWLGPWWRPGHPEIGGKLTLDKRGVRLTLFGSLADWGDTDFSHGIGFPLHEPHRLPVVYGRSSTPLTVLNAQCDFPLPPGTRGSETWDAEAVVEAHLDAVDDAPTFTGLRLELEALPAWARARGVAVRCRFNGSRTEVVVEPHDLGCARLPGGEMVQIEQAAITSYAPREYGIRQPVTLAIEDCDPAGWSDLLNRWLQPIQVLLWIATGQVGRVETLELLIPRPDRGDPKWAKLWASLVEPLQASRELTSQDVLFFADELPRGLGPGLARWFTLWIDLRHVLGPLYARASAPFAYANDRFYTAVAAIEAYHRYCVQSESETCRGRSTSNASNDLITCFPSTRPIFVNGPRVLRDPPIGSHCGDDSRRLPMCLKT